MGGRGDKQRARWACGTCGKPLQSVLTVLSEPAHSVDHKNVHCARGPRAHGGCVQINEGALMYTPVISPASPSERRRTLPSWGGDCPCGWWVNQPVSLGAASCNR